MKAAPNLPMRRERISPLASRSCIMPCIGPCRGMEALGNRVSIFSVVMIYESYSRSVTFTPTAVIFQIPVSRQHKKIPVTSKSKSDLLNPNIVISPANSLLLHSLPPSLPPSLLPLRVLCPRITLSAPPPSPNNASLPPPLPSLNPLHPPPSLPCKHDHNIRRHLPNCLLPPSVPFQPLPILPRLPLHPLHPIHNPFPRRAPRPRL